MLLTFHHHTFAYRLIHFPLDISFDVIFPYSWPFQCSCWPWLHSGSLSRLQDGIAYSGSTSTCIDLY